MIVMLKVGNVVAVALTALNPESKPTCPVVEVSARETQGSSKLDWVTVWFFGRNWNVMVSPIEAEMLDGLNTSLLSSPTITRWF